MRARPARSAAILGTPAVKELILQVPVESQLTSEPMVAVALDQIDQVRIAFCYAVPIENLFFPTDTVRDLAVRVQFAQANGTKGEWLFVGLSDQV